VSSCWLTPLLLQDRLNTLQALTGCCNPDLMDKTGQAAIHIAASRNDVTAVRMLCDAGADLDLCDGSGWTPLHHAAVLDNGSEMVEMLLAKGAKSSVLSTPQFMIGVEKAEQVLLRLSTEGLSHPASPRLTLLHSASLCFILSHPVSLCFILPHSASFCLTLLSPCLILPHPVSLCFILPHSASFCLTLLSPCLILPHPVSLCFILPHSASASFCLTLLHSVSLCSHPV
jgi:hypothetical protein